MEGSNASAKAQVQIIPENVEYMIDCNNPGSSSWKNASALEGKLLNEAADLGEDRRKYLGLCEYSRRRWKRYDGI